MEAKCSDLFRGITPIVSPQLHKKELEAEFGHFDDWVKTYELFRGKASDEDGTGDERFVGKFKVSVFSLSPAHVLKERGFMADGVHCVHIQGRFCLYKLTEEEEDAWDELADAGLFRVSRGIPSNNPVQVLIRVYVVSVGHFASSNHQIYTAGGLERVFSSPSAGIKPAPS